MSVRVCIYVDVYMCACIYVSEPSLYHPYSKARLCLKPPF